MPAIVTDGDGVCVCSECSLDEDDTTGVRMSREVASEVDGITLLWEL